LWIRKRKKLWKDMPPESGTDTNGLPLGPSEARRRTDPLPELTILALPFSVMTDVEPGKSMVTA
jgi:hypothetical protein